MISICTIYDSHYLNRGLALYESIERYTQDYIMYVLAMDDICFNILNDMQFPRIIPISISDFETEKLKEAKRNRSIGEYCWTCKAPLIKYVLDKNPNSYCAYLDSDLYFYNDPHIFITEMESRKASVLLFGHRYNRFASKHNEDIIGKYCAGTIVFKADNISERILNLWELQCLDCCKLLNDGIHFGDQKYLDNWTNIESAVVETTNMGSSIASWNLARYKLLSKNEFGPESVIYKNKQYSVLFYHYHALVYTAHRKIKTFAMIAWGANKELLDCFYIPYLTHIDRIESTLKSKYGLNHFGYNPAKCKPISTKNKWKLRVRKLSKLLTISGWRFLIFEDLPTKFYWKQDEVNY